MKCNTYSIENEKKTKTNKQRGGFLDMLLGTLGASLLVNLLAGNGVVIVGNQTVWAGDKKIRAGNEVNRSGQDF